MLGGGALKRSDLMDTPTARATGIYGFVIMGDDGKPDGGDSTIACFSNCGNYAFPTAPKPDCSDSDPTCYRWKAFCLNAPAAYGKKCSTDKDCLYGTGCWNNPGLHARQNLPRSRFHQERNLPGGRLPLSIRLCRSENADEVPLDATSLRPLHGCHV